MGLSISVTASGALFEGNVAAIVQSNLDQAITEATLFLDGQVKARTPQGVRGAQGGLLASIQNNAKDLEGKGTPLVKGVVMSGHPYAMAIEKGRRPGKGVPPDALREWIVAKLGVTDEKGIARANFFIQRKIKAHGFEGAHMFEKALNENWSTLQSIFERRGLSLAKELSL